jgi:hypothetical protein
VLTLQPGNPVALAGVAQIADQYASLASEALDSRNLAAARTNLERLRAVSPQHAQIAALQKRARQMEEQTQRKAAPQARTTPTPRSTPAERPPKVAEPPRQKGTEGAAQAPVPASPPPVPKTEEAPKRPRIWGSF